MKILKILDFLRVKRGQIRLKSRDILFSDCFYGTVAMPGKVPRTMLKYGVGFKNRLTAILLVG